MQAFERAAEVQRSNSLQWGNLGDAYRWVPGNADKAKDAYVRTIQLLHEQIRERPFGDEPQPPRTLSGPIGDG